jgi:hypothetical protein
VVIDDLDIDGSLRRPDEAHSELIVDPDAVLSRAVAAKRFEAIARRYAQVVEQLGPLQLLQLTTRYRLDVPKPLNPIAFEQPLRVWALEGSDRHVPNDNVSR